MTPFSAKLLACAATLVLAAGATACDPCAGTAACGAMAPRLVLDGQIVRAENGRGVDGIRIDVVRVGGAEIHPESLSVTTSQGGFWRIDAPVNGSASGNVVVNVTVHTPTMVHPYVVRGLDVKPVTRHGDAVILDRWVSNPYAPYYVDFYLRGAETPLLATSVIFRPTSGPALYGPGVDDSGYVHTSTDPTFGRAQFFVLNAFVKDTGDIVGDAIVQLPPPYAPSVRKNVRLSPSHIYRGPSFVARFGAGPSLEYAVQLFDRATGRPLPNLPFVIQRVSGVALEQPEMAGTTDAQGYARLHLRPLGSGKVAVDITMQHPYGPEVRHDTLSTFDEDNGKLLGNWLVGPALPYYMLLRANAHDLVDVPVRVRRTGGVDVAPADTVVRTNIFGGLPLSPIPHGDGNVVLELTVMPPKPLPSFIVHNLVLPVVRKDAPGGIDVWNWEILDNPVGPPGTVVEKIP